ncbi:MAG: hypothetical protein FWD31_08450 [Planctomycetaceae bacterium]|nr:hypothetical protein [Planctomycetaceae bacterium]
MTTEMNTDNFHDLVFQGAKEAIDLEVQRLRDEGWPILVSRDGKVVDIRKELELQENGRVHFLLGIAFLLFIPIFLSLIYFDTQWLPISFVKSFAMLMGVVVVGLFGLGTWYGDRITRRNCLVFLTLMIPILAWLIYSYIVNGFF